MLDITPLKYIIQRALGNKALRLEEASSKTEILCPEEVEEARPALYIKDNLDLILKYVPYASPECENRRLSGGKVIHAPTVSYQLDHAKFLKGFFYSGLCKYAVTFSSPPKIVFSRLEKIDHAVGVSTSVGTTFFGHWLTDDIPLALLGKKYGAPIAYRNIPYKHANEYKEIFDIHPRIITAAQIDKVTLFQDFSQNSLKRARYEDLRARVRSHVAEQGNCKWIYVKRGETGVRRIITNEQEMQLHLESLGFITIEPEKLSPSELIALTLDASIIIGCEGSHMSHFVYTIKKNGCLICLTPPDQFTAIQKDYADCVGYHYGLVVGKNEKNGFSISIPILDKVLELYEAVSR